MNEDENGKPGVSAISRRDAVRWIGTALAATPLASLFACEEGADDGSDPDDASSQDPGDASTEGDAGAADATTGAADGGAQMTAGPPAAPRP